MQHEILPEPACSNLIH